MRKQLCCLKETVHNLHLVWKYPLSKTLLLSRILHQKVHINSTNTFLPWSTITYSILNPYFIQKLSLKLFFWMNKTAHHKQQKQTEHKKDDTKEWVLEGGGGYKFLIGTDGTNIKEKVFNNRTPLTRSCVNVIWSHQLITIVITRWCFSFWNCSPFSIFD